MLSVLEQSGRWFRIRKSQNVEWEVEKKLFLPILPILFTDRNVKQVTKKSKPVDTMQDNALSLTFFLKQKEEKREGECLPLHGINQF